MSYESPRVPGTEKKTTRPQTGVTQLLLTETKMGYLVVLPQSREGRCCRTEDDFPLIVLWGSEEEVLLFRLKELEEECTCQNSGKLTFACKL